MTADNARAALVAVVALVAGGSIAAGDAPPAAVSPSPPEPDFVVEEVAPGVHALIRTKLPGLLMDANVVFIVNDEDVVVVDTNLTPASARASLAALRSITAKPVRVVVNTHWHPDHVSGNQVYRDAFPAVEIVGHPRMREDMAARGADNRRQFGEQAREFVTLLKGLLDKGTSLAGEPITAEERASYEADIRLTEETIAASPLPVVPPTLTVADRLTLHRGARTIEVLSLGRSHTHADLVVHLPHEGVVVSGDLVVAPTPLIGGDQSFIADWAASLDRLLELRPRVVVPGHGPVLRDDRQVVLLRDLMRSIHRQTAAALARGETLEQARAAVDVESFRTAMAGDSVVLRVIFSAYGRTPGIAAVFREAGAAPPPR